MAPILSSSGLSFCMLGLKELFDKSVSLGQVFPVVPEGAEQFDFLE